MFHRMQRSIEWSEDVFVEYPVWVISVAVIVPWLLLNNTFSFSLCCALQYKESISISVNCNTDFLESVFILTLWIQKTQGLLVFWTGIQWFWTGTVILLQTVMVSPGTHLVNKSWVPLQNHWVPVQKTISAKLKMLGPLCDQTDKRCSFVKHNVFNKD